MSQDPIAALRILLQGDAPVTSLVDTRVYGIEVPENQSIYMPRKAIVVTPSGGPSLMSGSYVEHDTVTVDALCYGETIIEAARVRLAVFDAFRLVKRVVVNQTLIHWINPAGGYVQQREPNVIWPVAIQSFQVLYAFSSAA